MDWQGAGDWLIWAGGVAGAAATLGIAGLARRVWRGGVERAKGALANLEMIPALADGQERIESNVTLLRQQQRAAMSASSSLAWEADDQGRLVWASDRLLRLSGRRLESLTGSGWLNVVCQDQREELAQQWYAAVRAERDFEGGFTFVDGDGSDHNAELRAFCLKDQGGGAMGWHAVIQLKSPRAA